MSSPTSNRNKTASRRATARRTPNVAMASDASQSAAPANLEWARTCFNASLATCHGALRFLAQVRETQAEMLQDMDKALRAAMRQAESVTDVQELIRLQGGLASDNLGRATQAAGTLFRSWLEAEAELLEQARSQGADVAKLAQPARTASKGNGQTADEALANPALALLQQAQASWSQLTQNWLDTLRASATPH